ncbi:DUF2804 domain-containing protein [Neobacillus rhizophilus]|uniref:DUF2804 domain-containing protein n=1 Tax=Neobacillus rhizophilus TaxID=2833579 RepID=A0A942U5C4_9BACI|nr:DUF2804 domain-containing protein [Neobacillus rhizophilus]MBS4212726.1 DUF2804 domain-containing protein [Neobacillus rhizophilus]MBU8915154.1 DUF2804 domain-containing protein [Bacillus sp. FJAT-29953]
MQYEITTKQPLLDKKGHLTEKGWARELLLEYNRQNITAPADSIKEWDYYYTGNESYGVAFSMANLGAIRALSVHFLDFENNKQYMNIATCPLLENDSHKMPLDSLGDASFESENARCHYIRTPESHQIEAKFEDFTNGLTLEANLTLTIPKTESMVIVVPFDEDPTMFYYNQKINCLHPEGSVKIGDKEYHFSSENAFSVLDWGRGVWPKANTWYWGSGSGRVNGVDFGFNIGYGFGNTSAASENLLIYDGKVHKLDQIEFHIPESSFLEPWTFTSSDGRFEMNFIPVLDRHSCGSRGKFQSDQHQVFGKFSGRAILDDGTVIELSDFMGFAEKVVNSYL